MLLICSQISLTPKAKGPRGRPPSVRTSLPVSGFIADRGFLAVFFILNMPDTGIRGLTRGLATLPQGYQEPLAVGWKTPGELEVSKSVECDALTALTLLVG